MEAGLLELLKEGKQEEIEVFMNAYCKVVGGDFNKVLLEIQKSEIES